MKIILLTILGSMFSIQGVGQAKVSDLKPAHAIALEQFLSQNKDYGFLSENALDHDYLADMRVGFKNLKPYYSIGDFNRDGILDFALVLSRKGEIKDNGEEITETHRYDHPLAIAIFNGNRNGKFIKAFLHNIEAPLACFLNTDTVNKKKQLYLGVFESDADTRIFTPVGKGYIVEYPKAH